MLLLKSNAGLEFRNISGWRPIDELIATGNETLVPFVARHLPSDNCRLFKMGNLLRLDTSLLDFKNRDWVRGQLSIVVDANKPFESRICLIDHEHRSYQILDGTMMRGKSEDWLNETVRTSLHMPLVRMHIDLSNLSCLKDKSKMRWRKESNSEMIGSYKTQSYSISHVKISVKKRSEHLRKEDVRFLSTLKVNLKQGTVSNAVKLVQERSYTKKSESESDTGSCQRLSPRVSWEAYRSWKLTGNDLYIGLKPNLKLQTNDIKLTAVMTNDVDFKITYLLDMFKCFSPLRKFTKLNDAVMDSLPDGFPVRIDVPVAPSITGRVTFSNVELCEPGKMTSTGILLQDEVFRIPIGYVSSDLL
nr:hypothetical transcript [Hymenolepis microstoma]